MKRLHQASKPNLSFIILAFFLGAFAVARIFTFFFPSTTLVIQGYRVHHFWYGLVLFTIGGWLGINYRDEQTDRIAAVVFGIGGGLIGDEVGLLIMGNYYDAFTYTFVTALLVFAFMVTLLKRHGQAIITELFGFFKLNIDLYVGLFLALVSSAFLIQSDNPLVIALSGITLVLAIALILRRIVCYFRKPLTK